MRTFLIWAIRLLLWVGLPSLIAIMLYKIEKRDTLLWRKEIDRIERENQETRC